jgi:hypothetical protein
MKTNNYTWIATIFTAIASVIVAYLQYKQKTALKADIALLGVNTSQSWQAAQELRKKSNDYTSSLQILTGLKYPVYNKTTKKFENFAL